MGRYGVHVVFVLVAGCRVIMRMGVPGVVRVVAVRRVVMVGARVVVVMAIPGVVVMIGGPVVAVVVRGRAPRELAGGARVALQQRIGGERRASGGRRGEGQGGAHEGPPGAQGHGRAGGAAPVRRGPPPGPPALS